MGYINESMVYVNNKKVKYFIKDYLYYKNILNDIDKLLMLSFIEEV